MSDLRSYGDHMEYSDEVAGRLLMQVVITVLDFHHPRALETEQAVARAVRELGEAANRPGWKALLEAYGALAKALNEHMHEEEETILDRVQTLHAQKRLVAGSMTRSYGSFEDLQLEHDDQRDLLAVLESRLADTQALEAEGAPAANVRKAILAFAAAFRAHVVFEDDALVPALARFVDAPVPHSHHGA